MTPAEVKIRVLERDLAKYQSDVFEASHRAREYDKARDAEMVRGWFKSHHDQPFIEAILPPVGIVIEREGEPVGACWLYMAVSVGVCWLEYPVTKPGLTPREARAAMKAAVGALEAVAKAQDYGVIIAHTLPTIAKIMSSFGYEAEDRTKVTVAKLLN